MDVVGHVSIVGAGPGDPSLLTRRAVARLRAADLVLYDALVDLAVMRFARRAQKFYVGKRAGRHAVSQDTIHTLMIRAARKGKRVVRLKGGDPFVFGRGGEEALALRAAGVSFDIVPGVTNAVAAPGLAGIPVTHRGTSSGVVIVSGHEETAFASAVGRLAPNGLTLVILMGIGRSAGLAGRLIDLGWSRATPAAIVADASLPSQRTWYGTLGDLASTRADIDVARAGTIVVGAVAALQCTAGGACGPREVSESSSAAARARGGAPRAVINAGQEGREGQEGSARAGNVGRTFRSAGSQERIHGSR